MLRSPMNEESVLQDRVEAGNGTQRHQGAAVSRVLVRARADIGKPNAPTTCRQGFRGHAQQRTCLDLVSDQFIWAKPLMSPMVS